MIFLLETQNSGSLPLLNPLVPPHIVPQFWNKNPAPAPSIAAKADDCPHIFFERHLFLTQRRKDAEALSFLLVSLRLCVENFIQTQRCE